MSIKMISLKLLVSNIIFELINIINRFVDNFVTSCDLKFVEKVEKSYILYNITIIIVDNFVNILWIIFFMVFLFSFFNI